MPLPVIRRSAARPCALLAAVLLASCQGDERVTGPAGGDAFARYVAIGTSVSMGTMGDGVLYSTQQGSWVSQLARAAGVGFRQPLVSGAPTGPSPFSGGGCNAPLVAPLQFARRLGGRPVITLPADTSCSPLLPGITLPTNNVALDGALAYDALNVTPESASVRRVGRAGGKLYARVLAPRQTQVSAMLAQRPTFVSVELGVNEVLGAQGGLVLPGTTVVPLEAFRPTYDAIVDSVKKTGARALLVGIGLTDIAAFPAVRRASELAADSAAFLRYNVALAPGCLGADRDNLVQLGFRIPLALAAAQVSGLLGQRFVFSCANVPGTRDGVLSPAEAAQVNALVGQLDAYIRARAVDNGYAYFELGALYATAKQGVAFSLDRLLTSDEPYGPLISLDGVHPSRAGHTVLAGAAADAIRSTYPFIDLRVGDLLAAR
jgi:lysophospholipase L1-like esterase